MLKEGILYFVLLDTNILLVVSSWVYLDNCQLGRKIESKYLRVYLQSHMERESEEWWRTSHKERRYMGMASVQSDTVAEFEHPERPSDKVEWPSRRYRALARNLTNKI
jgi:hypothetical protein